MHAATIGGRTIHYRLDGPADGPALVFANSLGTDLRVWDPLLPHLPAGFRRLRYDKPGHGLSDHATDHGIADHARDLLALMDDTDIDRATVVGLSVGGQIALALADAAPERVRALVLCDTAHRIGTPELWDQRLADIEAKGLEAMADGVLARWFSPGFAADRPAELALWRNMLVRTPAAGYAAVCRAIREADLTAAAGRIGVPTLCLAGAHDGATPPETVRAMADLIPGARYETVDAAGHLPCVEAPAALGATLGAFVEDKARDG